jgi:hypothetical protein
VTLAYLYCLVRSVRRPVVDRTLRPLPGATDVRVEPAGDRLWLVISHVPADDYGEAALARGLQDIQWVGARAMAHEAVVERFLDARAVLPMQLFTIFTSDERALAYVTHNRRRIERVLARVERQHEWGVRLTFQPGAIPGDLPQRASTRAQSRSAETGAGYLARKRDQRSINEAQLAQARTQGNRAYRAMVRAATAARRRSATEQSAAGSKLLVDAAFLVPVRRTAAFRAALRREARDLGAAGIALAVTGPWPPYNFVDSPRRRS